MDDNIFESPMTSFEFTEGIAERIAADWEEERMDSNDRLYEWIENGFIESIETKVARRLEK